MDGYNIIQDSGVNQLLGRRLNTVNSPASSLAPEVMPTVPAANWDASNEWLSQTRLCAARVIVAAAGPTFSGLRLRNGRASGSIVVVESMILVGVAATAVVDFGITDIDANLLTLQPSYSRDARQPLIAAAVQQTTCSVSSTTAAAAPTFTTNGVAIGHARTATSTTIELQLNYVLRPGTNFEIWGTAVNSGFGVTVHWSERRAQPSELG